MGFLIILHHSLRAMCFVDFAVWARRGKQKAARVAQRKERKGKTEKEGEKRITSRDRWCILADSRNPFHTQMKAVWEGECVCSVCMIGVAGQGLGLLAFPGRRREGGRERTLHNPRPSALSAQSVTDPRGNHKLLQLIVQLVVFMSVQTSPLIWNIPIQYDTVYSIIQYSSVAYNSIPWDLDIVLMIPCPGKPWISVQFHP